MSSTVINCQRSTINCVSYFLGSSFVSRSFPVLGPFSVQILGPSTPHLLRVALHLCFCRNRWMDGGGRDIHRPFQCRYSFPLTSGTARLGLLRHAWMDGGAHLSVADVSALALDKCRPPSSAIRLFMLKEGRHGHTCSLYGLALGLE